MLNKPDSCIPCPLYQTGVGFVPGKIVPNTRLMVIGQNPGKDEEEEGEPLVGKTGEYLESTFLPFTGEDEYSKDNVIRCRWRGSNDLPTGKLLDQAIQYCSQYDNIPDHVELVIAMGAVALRKFNPELKQNEWAGHLLPEE